ncbi:hypothetical protein CLF_112253, partial [Clonorchis sinensis]
LCLSSGLVSKLVFHNVDIMKTCASMCCPNPHRLGCFGKFPPMRFQSNLSALITLSLRAAAMSTLNSQRRSNQPTRIGDNRVGEMIASCQVRARAGLNAAEPIGYTRDRTDILFRHCRRDEARVTATTASRQKIPLTPIGVLRTADNNHMQSHSGQVVTVVVANFRLAMLPTLPQTVETTTLDRHGQEKNTVLMVGGLEQALRLVPQARLRLGRSRINHIFTRRQMRPRRRTNEAYAGALQIVTGENFTNLKYAAYIVLIFEDGDEVQALLNKPTTVISSFSMRLALSKCKVTLQDV